MNRFRVPIAVASTVVLGLLVPTLAACAPSTATADGRISVVASTDVYGQIVDEIGGDRVDVASIIDRPSLDPHEYEASARDQLAVSRADLIVVNGGGYDPFMDRLATASGTTAPVIRAFDVARATPGWDEASDPDNEHVFYSPVAMAALATALADRLGTLDPAGRADFEAAAATFGDGITGLRTKLEEIRARSAGAPVFATEPLAGHLLDAAGLDDVTPDEFSEAAEAGQAMPPAALLESLAVVRRKEVRAVIVNAQSGGVESQRIADAARSVRIPVLEFTETLPEGKTYLTWMSENIRELAKAVRG